MSVLDKDCCLGTAQAVTASAGTTDYFALGNGFNAPAGNLYLQVNCTTTADSANDTATVVVGVQVDDNTGFSTPETLAQSGSFAIASAELTAGGVILVPIPWNASLANKYLRGYFTVGTQDLSAGAFTTHIVTNPPRNL